MNESLIFLVSAGFVLNVIYMLLWVYLIYYRRRIRKIDNGAHLTTAETVLNEHDCCSLGVCRLSRETSVRRRDY